MAPLIYRTTGAWGAGKGGNLTPAEVDGNFHELAGRIAAIADVTPDQIDTITASGTQMTVTLTDARTFTVTLPVAEPFSRVAAVSTATRTLAIADAWSFLRFTASGGCEVTIPANSAVPYPIGTEIRLWQAGAGAVTLDDTSIDIINAPDGADYPYATREENSVITIKKVATDTWDVYGDLAGTGGGGGGGAVSEEYVVFSTDTLNFGLKPEGYGTSYARLNNNGPCTFFKEFGFGARMTFFISNTSTAGTLNLSAFNAVTGDALTTVNGDRFIMNTTLFDGLAIAHITKLT